MEYITWSPATFLSNDSLQAMVGAGHTMEFSKYATIRVCIQGYRVDVYSSPAGSHFEEVNVIGSDFLAAVDAKLIVDYGEEKEVVLEQGPMRFVPSPNSPSSPQ
ncbi:hypothetical protein GOP47_0026534 [Adiantum capillus-veneris]|nr:hypothetical protein GOP47_0026534 [Adiantum capillus-veneris]